MMMILTVTVTVTTLSSNMFEYNFFLQAFFSISFMLQRNNLMHSFYFCRPHFF